MAGTKQIIMEGTREGRPSKRLTLLCKGLKLNSATIKYIGKNKQIEHEVTRINHLPKSQEVRLHTSQLQYPGRYYIELSCSVLPNDWQQQIKITQLTSTKFSTK